ncbi:MAG: metal-dependent transcriptional regulator [Actinobacteria bacterium]|jgi:Mn-dependent transcriptional regulator|nr:metal-dependent transcriptional regulator [Actinomycetota bacterium]
MTAAREETDAERRESLTAPVEDYLKAIYTIGRGSGAAATNEIAQRLALAPASVSGMVRRLADQGLLAYERYHGVKLTESGRRAALRTLRRHRVIEAYLARALGYPWDRVHDEAERLEHAVSDELVDRMAATIGEPVVDPHGAPIPTRDGAVDETEYTSLAELSVGASGVVARVTGKDPELLRYLGELSIRPGRKVTVKARAPFDGPITLGVGKQELSIGPALAGHVLIANAGDRGERRG